jgi:hypothetical protein
MRRNVGMTYANETTGAAAAAYAAEGIRAIDADTTEGASNGFFDTPDPDMPLPKPKKHRGTVSSVITLLSKEKRTGGIEITIHSDSNGKDYTKTIWVLEAFRDNPRIDPETLRDLPVPEGKEQSPFQRYGRTIRNKKGTGELQQLLTAGTVVGRTYGRYNTFVELGEVLNSALQGTPVIFTDQAKDTLSGFKVEVNTIYPYTHDFSKIRAEAADGSGE